MPGTVLNSLHVLINILYEEGLTISFLEKGKQPQRSYVTCLRSHRVVDPV